MAKGRPWAFFGGLLLEVVVEETSGQLLFMGMGRGVACGMSAHSKERKKTRKKETEHEATTTK